MRRCAWVILPAILAPLAACSQYAAPVSTELAGSYSGTILGEASDTGEDPVVVELVQHDRFVVGHGQRGSEAFAFAVLGSWGGPTLIRYRGRTSSAAGFVRTPGGIDLELIPDHHVALSKTTSVATPCAGPYTGRFSTGGPMPLELTLWQWGELVSGHGRLGGQPVVLAGYAPDGEPARLGMLLPDLVRLDIEVERMPNNRRLRVHDLGMDMILRARQADCP